VSFLRGTASSYSLSKQVTSLIVTCEHLSIDDNLTVYVCRLLIPSAMCHNIQSHLHKSHQGTVCTKQCIRLTLYWPGIDNDIDNILTSCKKCQDLLPSNPRERKNKPTRPFQEICADFCYYGGHDYFLTATQIARTSQWASTHQLPPNSSIEAVFLLHCRARHPMVRGPQFISKHFCNFYVHTYSFT